MPHVGLPKTGTTTLQTNLFPKLDGYSLKAGELMSTLWISHLSGKTLKPENTQLTQLLEILDRNRTVLMSREGLSAWTLKKSHQGIIWPTQNSGFRFRHGTDPLASFLSELSRATPTSRLLQLFL